MPELIHDLIEQSAAARSGALALAHKSRHIDYEELLHQVSMFCGGLHSLDIKAGDRVAIYLPKQPEAVFSIFGTSAAGACFVPVNPLLKAKQLAYILAHCNAKVLVTSWSQLDQIADALRNCPELETLVLVDEVAGEIPDLPQALIDYGDFSMNANSPSRPDRTADDMAAILYTSGSTGMAKGVALSHRNLILGAESVSGYLENTAEDRVLSVLPLSFDAGLSQLTTAFSVGASVTLIHYLMPRDVVRAVEKFEITGLTAVPPLWNQLCHLAWPEAAKNSLRYITSTGGTMPIPTTRALQKALPNTDIFLMYGLTEAFRSTYLPPEELSRRPGSIGKAIPHADVYVVNRQGQEAAAGEEGELVHCGPLVSLGYWGDEEATRERFRPPPSFVSDASPTAAVWSGDTVTRDEEGFLYFVGRRDDMIKTSGYRVSPSEVETIAVESNLVSEAVAIAVPHPELGQAILLIVNAKPGEADVHGRLVAYCRKELPNYMVPAAVFTDAEIPLGQTGKIDRVSLRKRYENLFAEPE